MHTYLSHSNTYNWQTGCVITYHGQTGCVINDSVENWYRLEWKRDTRMTLLALCVCQWYPRQLQWNCNTPRVQVLFCHGRAHIFFLCIFYFNFIKKLELHLIFGTVIYRAFSTSKIWSLPKWWYATDNCLFL